MSEYHVRRVVFDAPECDKPAPLKLLARRCCECLGVRVEGGFLVPPQNPLFPPLAPKGCRPRIYVVTGMVSGLLPAENNANKVIRAGGVIAFLHCRSDLVVGLSNHLSSGYLLE